MSRPIIPEQLDNIVQDMREAKYSDPVEVTSSVIFIPSDAMMGKPNVVVKVNPYTNLLGNIGDFEIDSNKDGVADGWTATAGLSPYLNWVHNIYGQYSQEVSLNGTGTRYIECTFPVIANKYYFASMDGELSQGDGMVLQLINPDGSPLEGVRFSTGKERKAVKVKPTISGNGIFRINIEGTSGYGWIDGAMVIEITATEYNTLTVGQLIQKYPYISGSAAKSISNIKIKSIGKNLFDKSRNLLMNKYVDYSAGVIGDAAGYSVSDYIAVESNTTYIASSSLVNLHKCYYDSGKNYIGGSLSKSFTTPDNTAYMRISFLINELDTAQIKKAETPYEPYSSTEVYFNETLKRLNNTTYDELRNAVLVDGKLMSLGRWEKVQRVSNEVTIKGANVSNLTTPLTNLDVVHFQTISDYHSSPSAFNTIKAWNDEREYTPANLVSFDTTENTYKAYLQGTFRITVPKGTFANLAAAQTYFDAHPITLTYKLANEITTTLNGIGELIARPGGSIIVEAEGALPALTYSYSVNLAGQVESSVEMIKSISRELTSQPEYSAPVETISSIIPVDNNASKGQLQAIIKGNTAANMVKNGNFANGTTGWLVNLATIGVSNNVLSITGAGTGRYPYAYNTVGSKVVGRKYYIRAGVRVTNSNCTDILVDYSDDRVVITNPTANNWYKVSAVLTATNTSPHLYFQHYYADAATANGKVMQVRDVMVIDLTLLGLSSLTVEQCEQRFPSWFDGMKSADNLAIKAVGKNLFDKSKISNVIGQYYETSIKVKPNTLYTARWTGVTGCNWRVDGANTGEILQNYTSSTATFNTKSNTRILLYLNNNSNISNITPAMLDSFQLEEGTISTPKEPHTSAETYIPEPLRSTPNMAYDELKNAILVDGKLMNLGYWEKTQRVGVVTITGSESWAIDSTWSSTNNICFSANTGAKNTAVATINHINDRFTPLLRADMAKDVEGLYMSDWEVGTVEIKIARTKLSAQTVEGFKAWLASNPVTLLYQLSTPVISKITNISDIVVEPGGSIIVETDGVLPAITYSHPINLLGKIDSSIEMIKSLSNSKANRVQENWVEITLLNGWITYDANYQSVGCYKDEFGVVRLKGVTKGGAVADATIIAILPVGYRPSKNLLFLTFSRSTSTTIMPTEIVIRTNGEIRIWGAANTYMTLEGIAFRV